MAVKDVFTPKANKVTEIKVENDEDANFWATKAREAKGQRDYEVAIAELERVRKTGNPDGRSGDESPFKVTGKIDLGEFNPQKQAQEAQEAAAQLSREAQVKEDKMAAENQTLRNELTNTQIASMTEKLSQQIAELRRAKDAGADGKSILEQFKDIKAAADELGLLKEKEVVAPVQSQMPPEFVLEMKKMDINVQLLIQKMENERQHQAQQWEMDKIKFSTDTKLKEKEIDAQAATNRERNQMLATGVDGLAKVIMKSATGGGGGSEASPEPQHFVEAGIGEAGEIPCDKCGANVVVARDAVRAICPTCNTAYSVKRVAASPVQEDYSPVSEGIL